MLKHFLFSQSQVSLSHRISYWENQASPTRGHPDQGHTTRDRQGILPHMCMIKTVFKTSSIILKVLLIGPWRWLSHHPYGVLERKVVLWTLPSAYPTRLPIRCVSTLERHTPWYGVRERSLIAQWLNPQNSFS